MGFGFCRTPTILNGMASTHTQQVCVGFSFCRTPTILPVQVVLKRSCLTRQGVALLSKYGMDCAPMFITEDATAATPCIDVTFRDGKYVVYGLCGGSTTVASVLELRDKLLRQGLAKALYLHVLVPMVPHGTYLPVLGLATDGTEKAEDLAASWHEVDKVLATCNATAMGHCGDGASTFRCECLIPVCGSLALTSALCARWAGKPETFAVLEVGSMPGYKRGIAP